MNEFCNVQFVLAESFHFWGAVLQCCWYWLELNCRAVVTFLSISPNVLYRMKTKPQEISSQKNYCPHVCVIATVLLHLCSSPHVLLFEKYSLNSPSLYLSVTLSHKSAVELWFRSALLGAHLKLSSAWWRTVHSQHIHCVSLIEHCSELVYCLHSSCGRIKKVHLQRGTQARQGKDKEY